MTKKLATIRGMATGIAVLMTCLYTACGGGNGAQGADPLSFADAGAEADSGVLVAAAGNAAVLQAAGSRKAASGVPPSQNKGEGTTAPPTTSTEDPIEDPTADPTTEPTAEPTTEPTAEPTTTVAVATATPTPTATDASMLMIDISKIPPAAIGTGTLNVAPTDQIAPTTGGAFRVPCAFAHMSFDDPIVFPGQPGRSHLHTFFGNTGTDANSTPESIRGTGNSTCRGGIANRTAYWVPTLIDTRDNAPIKPDAFIAYYKNGGMPAAAVHPLPVGLRMVAGDPSASGPIPKVLISRWKCLGGPNNQNGLYQASIGNCDLGAHLTQEVYFPPCWDGVNLDSPDHKSHMSYSVPVTNPDGKGTHRECPKTHPVLLPHISFNVRYVVREKDAPLRWRLSSDTYDRSLPGGYSGHGDWFNGWKSDISEAWGKSCLQAGKECYAHLLGDGRKIFGP